MRGYVLDSACAFTKNLDKPVSRNFALACARAGSALVILVLLIYRSTLTMHEDEQLFLDESSSAMAEEQRDLVKRVNRINPLIKAFGGASGALILVKGIWVYQALTAVQ